MSNQTFTGINVVVFHPQRGVPMGFHKIARAEHDLISNKSHIIFASYYSEDSAANGMEAMSHNTVILDSAILADEPTLLQTVIDAPDNIMTGGTIVSNAVATDNEV